MGRGRYLTPFERGILVEEWEERGLDPELSEEIYDISSSDEYNQYIGMVLPERGKGGEYRDTGLTATDIEDYPYTVVTSPQREENRPIVVVAPERLPGAEPEEESAEEAEEPEGPEEPPEGPNGERIWVSRNDEAEWLDLILMYIPFEVITVWIAVDAILSGRAAVTTAGYWTIFGLVLLGTFFHSYYDASANIRIGSEPTNLRRRTALWTKWIQILLAVGGFVVWAYYLGGPFEKAGFYNTAYGAAILPLFTLLGPQLLPKLPPYLVTLEEKFN